MSERGMWQIALAAVAVLVAATLLMTLLGAGLRWLPPCTEDVVLLGTGDFEAGRWSSYVCGPAVDDLVPSNRPMANK